MPLLMETSALRLERRRWSSPQQRYLYTVSVLLLRLDYNKFVSYSKAVDTHNSRHHK